MRRILQLVGPGSFALSPILPVRRRRQLPPLPETLASRSHLALLRLRVPLLMLRRSRQLPPLPAALAATFPLPLPLPRLRSLQLPLPNPRSFLLPLPRPRSLPLPLRRRCQLLPFPPALATTATLKLLHLRRRLVPAGPRPIVGNP
jgi:hypothetical protein